MKSIYRYRISVKLVLFLLLITTLGVYFVSRKQQLIKDFEYLLEKEAEKALNRNVEIESIRGGIFRPIILRNIKITYSKKETEPLFTAKIIKLNKKLWNLFFIKSHLFTDLTLELYDADLYPLGSLGPKIENQSGRLIFNKNKERLYINLTNRDYYLKGKICNIYNNPSFDMDLNINSRLINGRFTIKGTKEHPEITGALNLFDNLYLQDEYLTKGEIDLVSDKAKFTTYLGDEKKIQISVNLVDDMHFKTMVDISHLKVKNQDIVLSVVSDIKINKTKNNKFKNIEGSFKTHIFILNYKPIENIKGSFTYSNGILRINELSMGDNYKTMGLISFKEPETIDLNIEVDDVKIEDASKFYAIPDNFDFSSTINSMIDIKGDLEKPDILIHLTSSEGNLQDTQFKSINLNLEGTYPILMVKNSRINLDEGYFIVEGYVDLRKITTKNMIEDLIIKSNRETIVWEGWDITKKRADSEVNLKKSIAENISLLYKTYIEDETSYKEKNKDEIELKYEILDNKNLKMRLRENEEFFGLENKIEF